jgi:chromosome partitioning protein
MAVVVTIMNMKGGVGKSTIAMHLGGALALIVDPPLKRGRRVLIIDYDPQFNLSQALLPAQTYFDLDKADKTVLSVLQEDLSALDPFSIQVPGSTSPPAVSSLAQRCLKGANGGWLDIIPSTLDLMYIAVGSASGNVTTIESRFSAFIADARAHYDVILIDCHPAGSILTKTSLMNSDDVVIPVVPHKFAARGIRLMQEFIESSRSTSPPNLHILFNLTDRGGVSPIEAELRANRRFSNYCLNATLHKYKVFSDPIEGNGLVWFSNKPYSTTAWKNLLAVRREFVDRVLVPRGV